METYVVPQLRPHIWSPLCWCRPDARDCECEHHECPGVIIIHKHIEPRPDNQPRMSSYTV